MFHLSLTSPPARGTARDRESRVHAIERNCGRCRRTDSPARQKTDKNSVSGLFEDKAKCGYFFWRSRARGSASPKLVVNYLVSPFLHLKEVFKKIPVIRI